jgi:hypothetical protein
MRGSTSGRLTRILVERHTYFHQALINERPATSIARTSIARCIAITCTAVVEAQRLGRDYRASVEAGAASPESDRAGGVLKCSFGSPMQQRDQGRRRRGAGVENATS